MSVAVGSATPLSRAAMSWYGSKLVAARMFSSVASTGVAIAIDARAEWNSSPRGQ